MQTCKRFDAEIQGGGGELRRDGRPQERGEQWRQSDKTSRICGTSSLVAKQRGRERHFVPKATSYKQRTTFPPNRQDDGSSGEMETRKIE